MIMTDIILNILATLIVIPMGMLAAIAVDNVAGAIPDGRMITVWGTYFAVAWVLVAVWL